MEKELILTYLQGLDKKFDTALERLNANSIIIASHTEKLDAVQAQTTNTSGRVTKLEDDCANINRILAEQVHINSKLNGQFSSHHQWVEQKIKEDKEFAMREINELKKNLSNACEVDSEVEVEKIKAKTETWKLVVTSVVSIITATLASVGIKLTLNQ